MFNHNFPHHVNKGSNQEEQQSDGDERGKTQAVGFAKLVGNDRRHAVARSGERGRDVVRIPNLALEVGLSKKVSLEVPFYYNPWKYSDSKQLKMSMVQPEVRYWLCDKFNGHFFGVHGMVGNYQTTGLDLPFSIFDDTDKYRYKGNFYGGGISYGYQFILGRHWNLEATLGIGYAYVTYKKYECKECGDMVEKSNKNYFGPTKAALSLIYLF